jgi:DNA-binding IclR family transcriptional regulator
VPAADPRGPERTVAVLRLLAGLAEPAAAATVARELGIPRASAYRILVALADAGFVTHFAEDRTWGLGIGAFEIGSAYLRQGPLERLARPLLARLAQRLKATAQFGVLHGTDFLYVVKETAPRAAPLVTDVGVRLPASLTASGRAMLGVLPARQIRALYPRDFVFPARTSRGPQTLAALRTTLELEARRGWASEDGEITVGLASVAAAVVDPEGWPVGAVAVTFPREHWAEFATPAAEVTETASRISRRLHRTR